MYNVLRTTSIIVLWLSDVTIHNKNMEASKQNRRSSAMIYKYKPSSYYSYKFSRFLHTSCTCMKAKIKDPRLLCLEGTLSIAKGRDMPARELLPWALASQVRLVRHSGSGEHGEAAVLQLLEKKRKTYTKNTESINKHVCAK